MKLNTSEFGALVFDYMSPDSLINFEREILNICVFSFCFLFCFGRGWEGRGNKVPLYKPTPEVH